MTARQITFDLLSKTRPGDKFTGWMLRSYVEAKTGKMLHYATAIRYMRIYRKESGRKIVNIDKMKSVYEVIN